MKRVSPKIMLLEPIFAHYRKDAFKIFLDDEDLEFEIVAGDQYQGIKSIENIGKEFSYLSFKLFQHRFYYLKGSVSYILSRKPDILISTGVDFHLIHTVIIFFVHRILKRKKFFWWSHATLGNQGRIGYIVRKLCYRLSDGVFAYNSAGRENLLKMRVKNSGIVVVNNSINTEDYGFLNYNISDKKTGSTFTILYSGRLTSAKKVDILIRALGILKKKNQFSFRCYIVGDGDIDLAVEVAKEMQVIDNIEFTGAKYGKEVHNIFLDSDLYVYPGGIGLSALHALSFGLPVITTDNLKLHFPEFELLVPGFNGDLFNDNSSEDLATKISIWRDKLKSSQKLYTDNCIKQINKLEYLPDIMASKVLDFLKSDIN